MNVRSKLLHLDFTYNLALFIYADFMDEAFYEMSVMNVHWSEWEIQECNERKIALSIVRPDIMVGSAVTVMKVVRSEWESK